MAIKRLPINEGMIKAVDDVGLVTHGAAMTDVYVDELGNINRRPGLVELCDLGTAEGIDGLYWWGKQSMAIAVSNAKTWKITAAVGTFAEITGATHAKNVRVTFADFGTALYSANGAKIKKITTTTVADLTDADAPTTVTHVDALDRYLLANQTGTGIMWWSDVNAPEVWTGQYAEAEALPDDLKSLLVSNMEINLLGGQSLEIMHDDGSSPFTRLGQGFVQSGTSAPYSFAYSKTQDVLIWLSESRQVVMQQGRTPVPVSLTMSKYIAGFATITDAIGDCVELIGRPYYILRFPTEGKCLVLDFTSKNWYEWMNWNVGTSSYDNFRGICHAYSPDWNLNLVGDKNNGKVYKFSASTYTDNAATMRSLVRTGHYNHGTEAKRKFSNALYFRLKRTSVVTDDATPDLLVRWCDNGGTSWTDYATVSLQQVANTEFRAKLTRLGSYYSRQWEFVLSDAYPLCLVSLEEDVDMEG